jgi:hypothetical protein
MSTRPRVALLSLIVVLAVVQPTLAGAETAGTSSHDGDVGQTVGAAVERHPSSAGATAEALRTVRADVVHDRGLTGAGVSVGVIGRGFDAGGAVAPHVAERRQIGEPPRTTAHDTAVAEVVAETAPDADLYLAGVGRTPTPTEYAAAVEWLIASGADVIVDSGSYFPSVAADERRITAAAERAAERDVVFVTSAGNYADRHWTGTGATEGWVTFADEDAANALADGDPLHGRVTVRLRWRGAVDYDLYLYRRLPNAPDRVVAKSVDDGTGPGLTVEAIDVAVPRGQYYVAVYADGVAAATSDGVAAATSDGAGNDVPGQVQVFAANNELEPTTARGSMVAPATSDRVVAVGATADGDRVAYSSLSASGTVDLTAPAGAGTRADPTLAGTSAAAPYVAGTAALVAAAGRDPSPASVEAILEETADGEDARVDALAAVEATTGRSASARGAAPTSRDAATTGVANGGEELGDATVTPDVESADSTGARMRTTNRSGRNVTRPVDTDDRRETTDGTDRSGERNRDTRSNRNGERDRTEGNATDDGAGNHDRGDDTTERRSRE